MFRGAIHWLSDTPPSAYASGWPKITPVQGNYLRFMCWRPEWLGWGYLVTPLWMPLAIIAAVTALLWWLDRRRIPAGHCQTCGYDLTGNVSGRCPECGTIVKSEEHSS